MISFLYGSSPYLELELDKTISKIYNDYPNIKVKYFDCLEKEESLFFEAIQSNSLFSNIECLILKRIEILKNSGVQKFIKSLKDFDLSRKIIIIPYNLPLQYNKPIAEYELTKANIKLIESVAQFIDSTSQDKKRIEEYIKSKLIISDKDSKELLELLGNDYYNIKNEIDKIFNFLNGEKYSFDKIKNIISIDAEYNLKELIDNFFKTQNYMELLEFIEKNKDSSMGFIYMFSEELLVFLKLSSLINQGKLNKNINYNVFKEIYSNFSDLFLSKNYKSQHPYVIYLKLNSFDTITFSEDFIKEKIKDLLKLEYKIKSGEADIDLEISKYLIKFYE